MGRTKCTSYKKVPIFRMEKRCSTFKSQKSKYKFPCDKEQQPVQKEDNAPLPTKHLVGGQKRHIGTINKIEERERKNSKSRGSNYNADNDDDDLAFDTGKWRRDVRAKVIMAQNAEAFKKARKKLADIKKWRIKHPPKPKKPTPSLLSRIRSYR
jgi:hypothetical protein